MTKDQPPGGAKKAPPSKFALKYKRRSKTLTKYLDKHANEVYAAKEKVKRISKEQQTTISNTELKTIQNDRSKLSLSNLKKSSKDPTEKPTKKPSEEGNLPLRSSTRQSP